ncbi:hypothetical protein KUL49_02500 [Alteromonas sp. KUL49]|nr:hypothetical protein KUL49_02500 [Alteromonas sp. KUL49]
MGTVVVSKYVKNAFLVACTLGVFSCTNTPSTSTATLAIEAEDYASQHLSDKRAWITFPSTESIQDLMDADPPHLEDASGGAYIELLPDTRQTHDHALVRGENFTNEAGAMAVLHYPVFFEKPGTYYVWARAYSTGSEDNGLHVGINGRWPASGQRLQLCKGKKQWTWSSAQRVKDNHCGVPNTIILEVPSAGVHTVMVSMREDGFELDKLLLTQDINYVPQGHDVQATKVLAQNNTQTSPITNDDKSRPNILFILADDHRWDMLGKYHPIVKTPQLDALANEGTVFRNAFVTTPICASSRVSILSGLTERTHDFTFQQPSTGVQESANMYPNLLKNAGYRTAFVGKYEIKIQGDNNERFDFFKPLLQAKTEQYEGSTLPQTYYIAELAKDFIEDSRNDEKPWVMAVNFWNPHAHDIDIEDQYHYPPEFESMYTDVTIPQARLSDDETFNALPDFLKASAGRVRWAWRYDTPEKYQRMIKRYYRAVSSVDKAVGMIRESLAQQGMAENTIIIYMGDNGYSLNERQLAGKWFGWDEDLRVPLIIYDPRQTQPREITDIALNIDIPSTIVDAANLTPPKTYQGESLFALLDNVQQQQWRDGFFLRAYVSTEPSIDSPYRGSAN